MMNLVSQEECRVEELLLHIQRKQMRWLPQAPEEDPGCEGGVLSSGRLEEEPELMVERRRSGCLCKHSREWAATCGHVQTGTSSKMSLNNYFLIHPALVTSDVTEVKRSLLGLLDLFSPSEQSPDVVTDVRTEVTEAGAVPVASCHFPSRQCRRAAR